MYAEGSFSIQAMSGPILKPGSKGNVTGDGIGFFWGVTGGGYLGIGIEGANDKARKQVSQKELTKKWFEKVREADPSFRILGQASQR